MNIIGFEKIAPYLTHPLVLVGFVLLLAYGIHWQLMKSGLLRQVSQKNSSLIIRLFLRYGFWLALILLLAGFGLQFSGIGLSAWNSYMDKEKVIAVNAGKVAEKLYAQLDTKDEQLSAKDEQIKALTEAVTALSKADAPVRSINEAMRTLERGETKQAKAIFAEVLQTKEAEGKNANKEAAAAARHLGALAYMNNPKEALNAYRKAVELDPDNAEGWNQLGILLDRTGEITQAEEAYRKVLTLGEAHQNKEEQAWAYLNLGNVYYTHGDLDKAEEMYRKALELDEALGRKEGMAANYGNLGLVYKTRGELDRAEEMHRKSLYLNQALSSKEGMAQNYCNLGIVYKTRGELDRAEEMHRKSLYLNQALSSKEGMAQNYCNLGEVNRIRGKLDQAEEMYRKSLEISEVMGSKEGMVINYGNLGLVYQTRGELNKAEEMHRKSLYLNQALSSKEGMAQNYCNLGEVYRIRGKLDQAEEMYRKSLEISEALGLKETTAVLYGNLGEVYKKRGNLEQAESLLKKSLSLYEVMGAMQNPGVKEVQEALDELAPLSSSPLRPPLSPNKHRSIDDAVTLDTLSSYARQAAQLSSIVCREIHRHNDSCTTHLPIDNAPLPLYVMQNLFFQSHRSLILSWRNSYVHV